jgi:integrase
MAVVKRPSKDGNRYQVRIQGSDGRWITETFQTRRDAEIRDAELKRKKRSGSFISNELRQMTVNQYVAAWDQDTAGTKSSASWRTSQLQMYRVYAQPIIGKYRLQAVTPALILKVLQQTKRLGRSSQTCLHVYNFLHKVFRDAVETHEILDRNPVKRNLKPQLEEKEADFLEVSEARTLLEHVRGRAYEVPIWLGVFIGLRVGEIQALLWENVDLERGIIRVRRTYVRRERRFKEYPKGRRWHDVAVPPELLQILRRERAKRNEPYVAVGPNPRLRDGRPPLCYESYLKSLKGYCKSLGLKDLATHNLRHSTSTLWMEHGASDADMKMLFAHSSQKVTERYIHFQASRHLGKVANVIRLFPDREEVDQDSSSQNLPNLESGSVDCEESVC